jgi:16S rRNA (guanine527-N7)-methyltransferase
MTDDAVQVFRYLRPGAAAFGIDLTRDQVELFGRFFSLLMSANQMLNLTAIYEPEAVVRRHFLDSLSVLPALKLTDTRFMNESEKGFGQLDEDAGFHRAERRGPYLVGDTMTVVDVGTGGGLPGLALAIARPEWSVTLIDSVAKKIRLVNDLIRQLQLPNVRAVTGRAEDLGRSGMRDSFDLCVARAVATSPVLVEYCAPLVQTGGRIALYKSGDAKREVESCSHALAELGCALSSVYDVRPDLVGGEGRFIIVIDKLNATPEHYPRRVGLPGKRPLKPRVSP